MPTYPKHLPSQYMIEEHNIVTCPPDLWPMIRQWLETQQALNQARS